MLVQCVNFGRSRIIFKKLYNQDIFLVSKRNIKTPKFEPPKFYSTPIGYLFKPLKAKKGSAQYKTYVRFWNIVLGIVNTIGIYHLIVNKKLLEEDFSEGFGQVIAKRFFRDTTATFKEQIKTLEEDRELQSEELLKLVEKANKPFQPFSSLPDLADLPQKGVKGKEKEDDILGLKQFEKELEQVGAFRLGRIEPAQSPTSEKEEEKVPKPQNETS